MTKPKPIIIVMPVVGVRLINNISEIYLYTGQEPFLDDNASTISIPTEDLPRLINHLQDIYDQYEEIPSAAEWLEKEGWADFEGSGE